MLDLHGPGAIAVLGGARGTNEDAYAWARLAKGVIGTDNVDAQLGDGLPAEVVLGLAARRDRRLRHARPRSCCSARTSQEELPVLFLRIKRAAMELGVPLVDLAPVEHALTRATRPQSARLAARRGVGAAELEPIAEARGDRPGPGRRRARPHLAGRVADATRRGRRAALADLPDVRFLSALRRGNVHGALDAGLAPGFLPGRVTLDAGARVVRRALGRRARRSAGSTPPASSRAAADGKIQVLVLLGADPLCRLPRCRARAARHRRRRLRDRGRRVRLRRRRGAPTCSCPCTLWGEKTGTVTNLEDRVQRVGRKVAPEGTAMDDWRIAVELAFRLGTDFDLATVDEVTDEIARVAPAHLGATAALLRRARDGVVLPLREHLDEIVLRTRELTIMADDGPGTSWDPIKVEGEAPTSRLRPTPSRAPAPMRLRPMPDDRDATDAARRTRRRSSRPLRERDRRCRARCTSGTARRGTAARTRRVRSAPRGRPHALRRRARRQRDADRSPRLVARPRAARQPARPRRARRRQPAPRCKITARPHVADPARRRRSPRCRSASRALAVPRRRHRPGRCSSTSTAPVTDLRVETLR